MVAKSILEQIETKIHHPYEDDTQNMDSVQFSDLTEGYEALAD